VAKFGVQILPLAIIPPEFERRVTLTRPTKMKTLNIAQTIGRTACLASLVAVAAGLVRNTFAESFPSKHDILKSPDKNYKLINRDAEKESDVQPLGGNHALFVKDEKTGLERKICNYNRHATALWSPDSQMIAITDFAGSDNSECFIYMLKSNKLVGLAEPLEKAFEGTGKMKNHHLYFEAVNWQKASLLKINVTGYGTNDPNGFNAHCQYDAINARIILPERR
jgi:hypothetical protein